jgi:hypothetical protein
MKKLFQRLLSKKTEKESQKLTAWLSDLADIDDIAALKLSTRKISVLFDEESLSINQKIDLIITLEELNQHRLEKLASQFVGLSNIKPELESNIAEACYSYCRQVYIFHLKLIEVVINPIKSKIDEDGQSLLIARAINAATNMLKWRAFVQQNPPAKVWLQIFLLYKIAYKQNLMSIPVELFSLSPATTISAFIVQICMLGQLKNASLDKQQIETAFKIIRAWITHAHISQKYNPEQYLFYIDLEQDLPAKRIRNVEPNEHCRYWELDDLEKRLMIAMNVTGRGEFPDSLIFSKINDPKLLNETLGAMHAEWTKKQYVRQRRRESRKATSKNAKVKAGIFEICDQVLHANQINNGLTLSKQGKSLDDHYLGNYTLNQSSGLTVDSSSLDTWIITDQSKHGLGARVNKYANTLARQKKLIALVFDDDPTKTCLGIIRAVKATQGNQLRVGIEIISNLAVWSQLKPMYEDNTFANTISKNSQSQYDTHIHTHLFPAIYLPKEPGISEQATMIIPKVNYSANTKYTVYMGGKTKRAKFDDLIESNDDWVKIAVGF